MNQHAWLSTLLVSLALSSTPHAQTGMGGMGGTGATVGMAQGAPATTPPVAGAATPAADTATTGKAVYYSRVFNGRKTYSGERFDSRRLVAAHRTLPMGTLVKVTNTRNRKSVVVRVIDRGPSQPERIIDVSRAAAHRLGFVRAGITDVSLAVVGKARRIKR